MLSLRTGMGRCLHCLSLDCPPPYFSQDADVSGWDIVPEAPDQAPFRVPDDAPRPCEATSSLF
eukprot:496814-Pyramimonas_sp.AAC.1